MANEVRALTYGAIGVNVTVIPAQVRTYSVCTKLPRDVRLLVLHSAECAPVASAAESLARWLGGAQAPRASWHFAVDVDSITQSVEQDNAAWHAGPVNGYSIGIEQAGFARWTEAEWWEHAGILQNTALLLAILAGQWDLPLDLVTDPRDPAVKGVTTHVLVNRAFGIRGGHTDPGEGYPMLDVLEEARRLQAAAYQ